ncbi:Acetyltransferase (GNAT) family protein [Bifidobacterium bohemicum]|uniref:GNAT family acetyltransferase n=2 Tax=Bifidobacterium bohemicum TaxID=638617 RepID=A0A086ZE98_9BIFI|nr:GNAT family acetyltransferase [Bifidobacterium bohemicum DSM 22767]SCB95449.1 Acetyltransferase (GNAT) family protein [Bifidobacterium bohemicum]
MGVLYAPMIQADLDDIVRQFDVQWGYGKDHDMSMLVSRRCVLRYLKATTSATVARLNGRFLGVTFIRVPGQPVIFPEASKELAEVDELLNSTTVGRDVLAEAVRDRDIETDMERRCRIDEQSDPELELFLVSSDARGKGVGGQLWSRAMALFRRFGAHEFFLHTDTDCDMGFYEGHGLERVAQWLRAEHPDTGSSFGFGTADMYIFAGDPAKVIDTVKR